MASRFPTAALALWLSPSLLLSACGRELEVHQEPVAPQGLLVRAVGPTGERPAELRLFLDDGATIELVDCAAPAAASGASCTAEGVHLPAIPARLGLVAKAKGLATARLTVEPVAPAGGGDVVVELPLAALPPFETNGDFATGFDEGGLDAFLAQGFPVAGDLGPTVVVKFYVELGERPEVWFQETSRHPLHYDFAHGVLGRALSLADFEARTYHGEDRAAFAGSLVVYPGVSLEGPRTAPLGVEFFPTDDLTPAQALDAYLWLEERLQFVAPDGAEHGLFYVPAGSAQEAALDGAAGRAFDAAGAHRIRRSELYGGISEQHLNPGVAYGTLRVVTPEELARAPVSFRDVIVLPRLPNELPLVGGTITEELQTPLAHVNVVARARGTPNLALLGAQSDARVAPLVGKLVRFEVTPGAFTLEETTLEEALAFWAERTSRPPYVPASDLSVEGLPDFADLGFADASSVGVKAANVAELWHLLGEHAPHGFAVPFSAYDRFLREAVVGAGACAAAEADCVAEGRALQSCAGARSRCDPSEAAGEPLEAFAARIVADPELAQDTLLREASLDSIRHVMRHTPIDPALAAALDAKVGTVFGAEPARVRSSTNAEDLEEFTGAGLYSSYTAFATGPDAASLQIRKVWASAFSFRAFEERSFWNVDHAAVKVGVLVHQAFPDERVNGVLITQNLSNPGIHGIYVNAQEGEISVTNPEGGALPEIFSIVPGPDGAELVRERFSSLSPQVPLLTDDEVAALLAAAVQVQAHFAPLYGKDPAELALDLEWKLHGPDRKLIVKQVRPFAMPQR